MSIAPPLTFFGKPDKHTREKLEYISYELTYPNQNFVLSFMHPFTPYKGLLLTYQLGNGKTYAAAALTHLYSTHGFSVIFLSHNIGTIDNFKKECARFLADHRLNEREMSFTAMGITKFTLRKPNIDNHLVIIDEAHNLRENAHRYAGVKEILDNSINTRRLIITATPMIDDTSELESLQNLIEPDAPIAYCKLKTIGVKITYIGKDYGYGTIFVSKMRGYQLANYKKIESTKKNDIYTTLRQSTMSVDKYTDTIPLANQSCKIKALIKELVRGECTAVFSFYVHRGVDFIADALAAAGFEEWRPGDLPNLSKRRFATITGASSPDKIASTLDAFNSIVNINTSVIEVIVGSSVINESISLKNVRRVHVTTPFWNYGRIEQAVGRAVRIGSHDDLPPKKRNVRVYIHAAVYKNASGELAGIDLDMLKSASAKQKEIDIKMKDIIAKSIWTDDDWTPFSGSLPSDISPHGRTVVRKKDTACVLEKLERLENAMTIQVGEWKWDLHNCFETNKHQISWGRVFREKAIGQNTVTGQIKLGKLPDNIITRTPATSGATLWRSCVDGEWRITAIESPEGDLLERSIKLNFRGRIVRNMNTAYMTKVSTIIGCSPTKEAIIAALEASPTYISEQIIVEQ
jgi:superfamily II DNA or RNA helicase